MMIKPLETESEMLGKAYVHWKSWQEAYADLLPQEFLQNTYTLERCQDWAVRYPQNILIAVMDDKVVGFVCYGSSSQEDFQGQGSSTPFMSWRTIIIRRLATSSCRQLWKNCRATKPLLSGYWRGMRVPLPSMKKWASDLMVSKKRSI